MRKNILIIFNYLLALCFLICYIRCRETTHLILFFAWLAIAFANTAGKIYDKKKDKEENKK